MEGYKLSKAADQDFENIFEFVLDNFGLTQVMKYQKGMEKPFTEIVEQPILYAPVEKTKNRPKFKELI